MPPPIPKVVYKSLKQKGIRREMCKAALALSSAVLAGARPHSTPAFLFPICRNSSSEGSYNVSTLEEAEWTLAVPTAAFHFVGRGTPAVEGMLAQPGYTPAPSWALQGPAQHWMSEWFFPLAPLLSHALSTSCPSLLSHRSKTIGAVLVIKNWFCLEVAK